MLFSEAVGQWLAYRARLVDLGLVRDTTHTNQTKIGATLSAELGDYRLTDLRKSHFELYVGGRLQTCAPVTVAGEMNLARQIINWCVDEQLLAVKPRLPSVSVPATEQPLPADEAFLWMLRALPDHHSRALEFMMLTGLSPHELERLQRRDERPTGIAIGGRPDFLVKQESRRRTVPLSIRAEQIWRQASMGVSPALTVFPSVVSIEKAIQRVRGEPRKLFSEAMPEGAEQITPKLMRKWFASKVAAEHPEHVLQRLLGHAPGSPITRKHYVRSSEDQLVEAVAGVRA
jgi:integrase